MRKRGAPRTSCDLCRRRKIRCDRLEGAIGETCSFCVQRRTVCSVSAEGARSGRLHGRDVRHPSPPVEVESAGPTVDLDDLFQDIFEARVLLPCDDTLRFTPINEAIGLANPLAIAAAASPSTPSTGIDWQQEVPLGFSGLTRALLEQSVMHYLEHVDPTLPILNTSLFQSQYSAYLAVLSPSSGGASDSPATTAFELLLLAVAAKGMGFLITCPTRHAVQQQILMRIVALIEAHEDPLEAYGLALLQTIVIVSDIVMIETKQQAWLQQYPSPLKVHPLSHEALVHLALQLLRRRTKHSQRLETLELSRDMQHLADRTALLKVVFILDALRTRAGQVPMIKDEQVVSFLGHERRTDGVDDWIEALVVLARISRTLQFLCYARSAARSGIQGRALLDILDRLAQWHAVLPVALQCGTHVPIAAAASTAAGAGTPSIQAAILRALWLSKFLVLQSVIVTHSILGEPFIQHEVRQTVALRANMAFMETVYLASVCTELGFFDRTFEITRNLAAACTRRAIERLHRWEEELDDESSSSSSSSSAAVTVWCGDEEELISHIEVLLGAVESARSSLDTAGIVLQLQEALKATNRPPLHTGRTHQCGYCTPRLDATSQYQQTR
ncbi:hypothetical protein FA10DRAFT_269973 [Acaromyces ingoldii]|uniref:Zn(2)-C6 fungal-type domain-containing protein n=1 Tax=Acaromyces ingoldii TaxID=215250 RepID=A0A316YFL3_9BASI|nr:hypothetical protein FA10DRAFT_269973 [Acaromyces ingoldii]PWN86883.1 hypothetical protein FA10DRAFT_269973 [Acaromyces ingoldii]